MKSWFKTNAAPQSQLQVVPEKKAGTHRTFPVPSNVPRKVLLFSVSSVFPYSKGKQGSCGEPLFSPFLSYFIFTQAKNIYNF